MFEMSDEVRAFIESIVRARGTKELGHAGCRPQVKDCYRNAVKNLIERAGEDCFPNEAARRLVFLEQGCSNTSHMDTVFALAAAHIRAPD